MKLAFAIILISFLGSSNISAQWIQQTVPDSASVLNTIKFTNTSSGISTGWDFSSQNITTGRALYTTNAGANWLSGAVPYTCRIIASVKYITPSIIYGTGAMNLSIDNSFAPHNIADYDFLGRIKTSCLNNNSIAGNNTKGTFFKSTDGGLSWFQYGTVPADCSYLTYSDFINENTGIVLADVGPNGTNFMNILKTTNGGLTWTPTLEENINGAIDFIKYASDDVIFAGGFISGTPLQNFILKSTNGGTNWIMQARDTVYSSSIHFINSQTGFTSGGESPGPIIKTSAGQVYKTTNQGLTWNNVLKVDTVSLFGVNFYGETDVGITFGNTNIKGNLYLPYVYRTSNFGLTWTMQQISNSQDPILLNSFMLDKYNYYISTASFQTGAIFHTNNGGSVGVEENPGMIPDKFSLSQNYPNPFNPSTSIRYNIPNRSQIILKVYNSNGKEIAELVNEIKSPGSYEIKFNAANLSSGIYYYKLTAGDFSETKKMILIK